MRTSRFSNPGSPLFQDVSGRPVTYSLLSSVFSNLAVLARLSRFHITPHRRYSPTHLRQIATTHYLFAFASSSSPIPRSFFSKSSAPAASNHCNTCNLIHPGQSTPVWQTFLSSLLPPSAPLGIFTPWHSCHVPISTRSLLFLGPLQHHHRAGVCFQPPPRLTYLGVVHMPNGLTVLTILGSLCNINENGEIYELIFGSQKVEFRAR